MAPNSSESCYAIYIVYKGKCQYQDKSETNNNSNVVKNHLVHISEWSIWNMVTWLLSKLFLLILLPAVILGQKVSVNVNMTVLKGAGTFHSVSQSKEG